MMGMKSGYWFDRSLSSKKFNSARPNIPMHLIVAETVISDSAPKDHFFNIRIGLT